MSKPAKKSQSNGNVNLYVYIPKVQKKDLQMEAKKKGNTVSALMRNILEVHFGKNS